MRFLTPCFAFGLAALAACSPAPTGMDASNTDAATDGSTEAARVPTDASFPARMPGARAPRTAMCDSADPTRCLLPWPSNVFTRADPSTPTGLRLAVQDSALPGMDDSAASLLRADGFSRASPVMTGVTGALDPASLGDVTTGGLRVFNAQPGSAFGNPVAVRYRVVVAPGGPTGRYSLLLAYPRAPMAPASEHLAVLLDSARTLDGVAVPISLETRVALGLEPPATEDEARLFAYHAPARTILRNAGIDFAHVARLWDFTTRSQATPVAALASMRAAARAAVDSGATTFVVDRVTLPTATGSPQAAIVLGHVSGLPTFLDAQHRLRRGADGLPVAMGTHDAPFRVALPMGTGSYRVLMYGHGTGGDYDDDSFDDLINSNGAAKVSIRFVGWTGTDVLDTFNNFRQAVTGTEVVGSVLLQSLADGLAIHHAMAGPLATLLAGDMLGTTPNPARGRRPDVSNVAWVGGSLGGTMGMILAHAESEFTAAVLNVPGAGQSHFIAASSLFSAVRTVVRDQYPNDVDLYLAVGITQSNLDEMDGANYADATGHRPPLLLQESIGDPVLPNIGNEFAAASVGATLLGVALNPVPGLATGSMVQNASGLTQYRVPSSVTAALDIHGFAARNTPAGVAAREQIFDFLRSVWDRSPRITIPASCVSNTPANSCDFSAR